MPVFVEIERTNVSRSLANTIFMWDTESFEDLENFEYVLFTLNSHLFFCALSTVFLVSKGFIHLYLCRTLRMLYPGSWLKPEPVSTRFLLAYYVIVIHIRHVHGSLENTRPTVYWPKKEAARTKLRQSVFLSAENRRLEAITLRNEVLMMCLSRINMLRHI